MVFNVRLYGHRGIRQMTPINPHHVYGNPPWMLSQPYEWAQLLATNGATPVTTVAVANDKSTIVRIEVADGNAIRYEINEPSRAGGAVSAGANSPKLSGVDQFDFAVGTTISIVDAASFP
jgi:hypothetical protein